MRGLNPLLYVGVTYSADGREATLWELIGNDWVKYDKIKRANLRCECSRAVPQ